MRGLARGGEILQLVQALKLIAEAVVAGLQTLLARFGQTRIEYALGFGAARLAARAVLNHHAGGIVDYDGDDVLLRAQSRDAERRVPQKEEKNRGENRLEQPKHRSANARDARGSSRSAAHQVG